MSGITGTATKSVPAIDAFMRCGRKGAATGGGGGGCGTLRETAIWKRRRSEK